MVAFCLGHPAIAQTNSTVAARHCFWKIQGKTNSVYLLGSIHFLNKDFYPLAQPIEDAFKNSATVVFEANLGEMEGMATQMKVLQDGQYPDGETLEKNISKETFQMLQKAMADSPLLPMMSQLRPWMAAMMIQAQQLIEMGFNPQDGVDHYFYDRAADKKIVGLETVDFQIGLLKGLSKDENEMFLKETILEMAGMKKIMSDLVNAWENRRHKKSPLASGRRDAEIPDPL